MRSGTTNSDSLKSTSFKSRPTATTFGTYAFNNGTTLNSTTMNSPTFLCTTFADTTLNSPSISDISFLSATLNNNYLNSTSFIGSVSNGTELNRTATNGQHPVVVATGTVFPRMPSELDDTPLSPVVYPTSEFEASAASPLSMSSFPLGSTTGKRGAEVTRSTPMKPPKKHRGPGEDREIKRCKRSLSFIPGGGADGSSSVAEVSETPEKSTEKTTTEKTTRPRASVERRNKRERMRVKQINSTFVTLRNQLPSDAWSAKRNAKKFSKVDTLRVAIDYIRGLRQLITDHDAMLMSAECLALLASTPTDGHEPSFYQRIPGFMVSPDSAGSDRSGAESVASSTTDHQTGPPSSSYPPSTSSASSFSTEIPDFFPPLGTNLSEDLLDAFLADMYMTTS